MKGFSNIKAAHFVIAIPLIWFMIFLFLPIIFMFILSFSRSELAMPPYQPVIFWEDMALHVKANFINYERLLTDIRYISTYASSIRTAFFATCLTLILGFPMAYFIARAPENKRNILLLLVILPFWTSFLLRVYALKSLLYNQGVLNNFLQWVGLTSEPIQFLNTDFAVYLGISYAYLPFMILPIYAILVKLPQEVLEASGDLGATPFYTFWQIVVPLAMPGIIAGAILVFIPAIGEFVIPDLLGGTNTKMIGKQTYIEFFNNRDWPMAAALSMAMLILVLVPYKILQKWQDRLEARNG